MVNWTDPVVMAACAVIFNNVSHLAIGAYIFEALQSFGFEWSVITGKRKFRWPMLLYLYCKWLLVCSFVGMLIAMNNKSPINCQALYSFNQFGGHSAIGGSTCLLMLRSMAIHKRRRLVVIPFAILACAHWAVLMWAVTTVSSQWVDGQGCVVEAVTDHNLATVYFLTLGVDTVVLVVTLFGLNFSRGQSGLWNMIWDQGLIYFGTAVVSNLVPAVVLMISLNPIMNIIFSIPAIAMTITVACRCFVTLSEYASNGDETSGIITSNLGNPSAQPWTHRIAGPTAIPAGIVRKQPKRSSVSYGHPSNTKENTIQFTREVQRGIEPPHHIDTIAGIMGNDIHLEAYSPSKTLRDSDGSSVELPSFGYGYGSQHPQHPHQHRNGSTNDFENQSNDNNNNNNNNGGFINPFAQKIRKDSIV